MYDYTPAIKSRISIAELVRIGRFPRNFINIKGSLDDYNNRIEIDGLTSQSNNNTDFITLNDILNGDIRNLYCGDLNFTLLQGNW